MTWGHSVLLSTLTLRQFSDEKVKIENKFLFQIFFIKSKNVFWNEEYLSFQVYTENFSTHYIGVVNNIFQSNVLIKDIGDLSILQGEPIYSLISVNKQHRYHTYDLLCCYWRSKLLNTEVGFKRIQKHDCKIIMVHFLHFWTIDILDLAQNIVQTFHLLFT